MKKILLVEDEPHLADGLQFNLEREGYKVSVAADGKQALELYQNHEFDLMVLDIMLPVLSGYEVAETIRRDNWRFPILMLSAKSQHEDRIKGLEIGVDDYLTKPFHLKELLLRIKAMFRRREWQTAPAQPIVTFGRNRIDFERFESTGRRNQRLTLKEAMIMKILLENEGRVVSREALLQDVWGYDPEIETRTLDNFIARLRKYFEDDPGNPKHILTVRGKGYRLVK
ncbi:MAG: response regulator transcription factor [bacterium]